MPYKRKADVFAKGGILGRLKKRRKAISAGQPSKARGFMTSGNKKRKY